MAINIREIEVNNRSTRLPKAVRVENYLIDNYDILYNTSTKQPVIYYKGKTQQICIDELCRELRNAGLHTSEQTLLSLFRTSFTKKINPLADFFESLRGMWKVGDESHIDKLAACLQCSLLHEVDYTERNRKLFRKWFIASVACAWKNIPNEVMLILLSDSAQGVGKTRFAEALANASEHIKLIKTGQSILNDYQKLPVAMTQYMYILFDEMINLSSDSEIQLFKTTICNRTIEYSYNRRLIEAPRLASCIGTVDKQNFLFDGAGTRRFGVIALDGIDYRAYSQEYGGKVDFVQMYAEAVAIIELGTAYFNYRWNDEDFADFEAYNCNFFNSTNEFFWLQRYFDRATKDDFNARHITSTEILNIFLSNGLPEKLKQNLNTDRIGKAMSKLGFEHTSKRNEAGIPVKGYLVTEKIKHNI